MSQCKSVRAQFSSYLDGALTGVAMQAIARHLEECSECDAEFDGWRRMQRALVNLGPAPAPPDLALRLRVALSQEHAKTAQNRLAIWKVRWQNTIAPFLLQASAGFASTIILVGTVALLVGTLAVPEPASARDDSSTTTSPRFLYSTLSGDASSIDWKGGSVVVEAYVDGQGRVYDYRIVSGAHDEATRGQLEDLLLFSVFQPARSFGQPVRGIAVLSFSGVSVQG
ncbi:zf-HC2 domain-containing protein [Paracidobacterium acidisoli]|uniref:zf-HC2 domain-containing protein n=1 Tax=Paracidobacterium acidisoli TaxID=2303751 RepID=UPI001314AC69|nr:zf-HC2 domain-containing protein [Paracidobacterium acidisoli]